MLRPPHVLLTALTLIPVPATAAWRGFNIKSNLADGYTCKSPSDWRETFLALQQFPNDINAVRLFSAHRCHTLAHAVPEAVQTGIHILVELLDDDASYDREKQALYEAIAAHGTDWIAGIAVGSESLFRRAITPAQLVPRIEDVRGMVNDFLDGQLREQQDRGQEILSSSGNNGTCSRHEPQQDHSQQQQQQQQRPYIKIGHIDTTSAVFHASNAPVLRACDFIGMNVYPYYQDDKNNHISQAKHLFDVAVAQARHAISRAKSDASLWITESGWPVDGDIVRLAVPSVRNAARYWREVACEVFAQSEQGEENKRNGAEEESGGQVLNTWWFTYQDWWAVPSFAVVSPAGDHYFSQSCVDWRSNEVEVESDMG